jgi:ATP-binding cassette, subfamily B, bacterial
MTRHVLGLDHEFHRTHTPGELIQRVDGDITSVSEFLGQVVTKAAGAAMLVGRHGDRALGDRLAARTRHGDLRRCRARGDRQHPAPGDLGVVRRDRAPSAGSTAVSRSGSPPPRICAPTALPIMSPWRFVEDSEAALVSAGVRRERAFLVMWWFVQGAVAAGTVFALVVGGLLYDRGTITVGTAFLLFQFVLLVARPLEEVVHELETVQKANGAMVRVAELLAVAARRSSTRGRPARPGPGPLAVAAADVSTSTTATTSRCCATSTSRSPPGRSVGIVGRTGSGKTTFSRLVLRLVDADERSRCALNGVPIAEIP